MNPSQLEPADRNPKREFITLTTILILALITGSIIFYQYTQNSKHQAEELQQGRAPEIGELTKNYSFVDLDDKSGTFFDYTGKITLIACFAPQQLDDSTSIIEILKKFEEKYAQDDRVQFLLLSMEDNAKVDKKKLRQELKTREMLGDKWHYAFSNGGMFIAYIKNQLKFIHLSKIQKEGKFFVSERIRILAPDLKLRGKAEEYDFGKMRSDFEQFKKEHPEEAKKPQYHDDFLVDYGRQVMKKNIDYMLANDTFNKTEIDAKKKKNIYIPYLWLFGGFALFLVVLGFKIKRKNHS